MENFIVAVILIVILGGAGMYVYRAKKRGVKCIGCPAGGSCSHKKDGSSECTCDGGCGGNCSCHDNEEK